MKYLLRRCAPLLLILFFSAAIPLNAQTDSLNTPKGAWARMVVENGDTIFDMALRAIKIWQPRKFKDLDEQTMYFRYKYAAKKVYPYALQAIALYEEIEAETQDMNKRKRKRYIRREHKELKEDFTDQMKNLSKTQGKILIKMIEKEVGKPFYDIVSQTRGGFTATYWHNLGKLYGYDLKQGYHLGDDSLLDEVLLDYDFGDNFMGTY
jgi:hypothetical protein